MKEIKPLHFYFGSAVCLVASLGACGVAADKDSKAFGEANRFYEPGTGLNSSYAVGIKAQMHTREWFLGGFAALGAAVALGVGGTIAGSRKK